MILTSETVSWSISALAGEGGMSEGPSCIIPPLHPCFCRTPKTFQVLGG
jgi:hypothetical protein